MRHDGEGNNTDCTKAAHWVTKTNGEPELAVAAYCRPLPP